MSNLNQYYKVYKLFLKNLKFKNIKYKPLIKGLKRFGGGRNKQGVITIRNRGGGAKRLYKKICFNYYYIINFKFFN